MTDSLRSMTSWAVRTNLKTASDRDLTLQYRRGIYHAAPSKRKAFKQKYPTLGHYKRKHLQTVARDLYDRDVPLPRTRQLTVRQQANHIKMLQELHDVNAARHFIIGPQSQDGQPTHTPPLPHVQDLAQQYMTHPRSPTKGDKDASIEAALSREFSYRFLPLSKRRRASDSTKARLTLNFKPSHSGEAANALAELIHDPIANPSVSQAKMMGPDKLGQRTDDAIVYFSGTDHHAARNTAANLEAHMSADAFANHTPFGMARIPKGNKGRSYFKGISYAETAPGGSSSHGSERKKIIAAAVQNFRDLGGKTQRDMEGHIGYQAYRHGYNPGAPAFVVTRAQKSILQQIKSGEARANFDNIVPRRKILQQIGSGAARTNFNNIAARRNMARQAPAPVNNRNLFQRFFSARQAPAPAPAPAAAPAPANNQNVFKKLWASVFK